jgi:ribosomal protein RSM22 (predicted rRNA methylase)
MRLPEELSSAIAAQTEGAKGAGVAEAAAELSRRYRAKDFGAPTLVSREQRLAYLMVRMPATFAACWRALKESSRVIEGFEPKSMLDLGAGPGTAMWAAAEMFASLEAVKLVEQNPAMRAIGEGLARASARPAIRESTWAAGDVTKLGETESADLVTISYAIGELTAKAALEVVRGAWERTSGALVIIEPGTPAGVERILMVRAAMIEAGAMVAAPCPHHATCPMARNGDWCHFSQRLERTAEHRRIKGGELGHEDEKFAYVTLTRLPAARPESRVVRHPQYRPKQVQLTLCEADGELRNRLVTKSMGARYRAAKKAEWGDGLYSEADASD